MTVGLGRRKLRGVTMADGMGHGKYDRVLRRGTAYPSPVSRDHYFRLLLIAAQSFM